MAGNSFNISDLYQQVFGLKGVRFAIPDASTIAITAAKTATFAAGQFVNQALQKTTAPDYYSGIETVPLPAANIRSVLGTPIYEQITVTIPAIVVSGILVAPEKTYTFPDWPLFDITGQDIIQKTMMTKKKGSTKENITEDDYAFTIRGILINYDSQEYPEQQLQDLLQIIKSKTTMGITSQVFNLLDVHNFVIERHSFPSSEGFQNIQPFELECLSDYPSELVIKDSKTNQAIVQGL